MVYHLSLLICAKVQEDKGFAVVDESKNYLNLLKKQSFEKITA
jgi:hypothetical protein